MPIELRPMVVSDTRLLVVEPLQPVVVGRNRLFTLRRIDDGSGPIDRAIESGIDAHGADILIFCSRPGASWSFDPSLTAEEFSDLGYHLPRTQLPTWRRFARRGTVSILHVGWNAREVLAIDEGKERILQGLEPGASLDRWVLEQMSVFLVSTLDAVLHDVVPLVSRLKESRRSRLKSLV
ncbi:MAG: hypothetical protein AAGE52_20350 [Myxococcota bacterium]